MNLTSNPDVRVFCNGSEVIFTCEIRGSSTLTWSGDFFYLRSPIGFANEIHPLNSPRNSSSNENTVATLTKNYVDGGVRVLRSTLRITALSSEPRGFVVCGGDEGTGERVDFQVLGELHVHTLYMYM